MKPHSTLIMVIVALALGALRQGFIKVMSLVAALPMEDEDGRPYLRYLGDVPPFAWQYSPWFRAGSWLESRGDLVLGRRIVSETFRSSRPAHSSLRDRLRRRSLTRTGVPWKPKLWRSWFSRKRIYEVWIALGSVQKITIIGGRMLTWDA